MMMAKHAITVAKGDGIGPEIMQANLRVLNALGADLEIDYIDVGEKVFREGFSNGIRPQAWDSLKRTRVLLKAPITTPQGGGFKSINVTLRKTLGLYANVRPCVSFSPFIATKHPKMDVVIVRENEEDLYAGIEHRQTPNVFQCLKLVTIPGSRKIIRYAFEYAKANGRKKVSCFTKDNIMKMTDGIFHKIFNEIASEYPEMSTDHWIVDIGFARLANQPELFDVIVTLNLYGDILSDIAAEISGSVGLAGSANIGEKYALFEAIHGSAPLIAGQNKANPSGLILSSVMMLNHLNEKNLAQVLHNAWLTTIEEGIHTSDVYNADISKQCVGTREFADALIERLGQEPHTFEPVKYDATPPMNLEVRAKAAALVEREWVGIDVFIYNQDQDLDTLADHLTKVGATDFNLLLITSRGLKVWPESFGDIMLGDHWRARFMYQGSNPQSATLIIAALLKNCFENDIDVIKTENLYNFDGEPGYTQAQGE